MQIEREPVLGLLKHQSCEGFSQWVGVAMYMYMYM